MYDYLGCPYPEGMLLNNNQVSFNHSDINNILYNGYENESYKNLNNILNDQVNNNNNVELVNKSLFKNIQFDENGVVIYTENNDINNNEVTFNEELTKNIDDNSSIDNPFFAKYEEKKIKDSNDKEWPIFKNIQFDENGIVISAEENR